jgi:hypothetical protein
LYFIDKNKYKDTLFIKNISVLSIDDERLTKNIKASSVCILGIFNAYIDISLIEQELKDIFKTVINPLDFFDIFQTDMDEYFWLNKKEKYNSYKADILNSYNLLEDDYSKRLFENTLEVRFSNNLELLEKPHSLDSEYFPKDINIIYPELKFADCGAYTGDTLIKIVNKNLNIKSFVAFEPDPNNLKEIKKTINNISIEGFIYPCGV